MNARKLVAILMAFVVLAIVTAWVPITVYPTLLAVLGYGLICAGLGVLVHTNLHHWKR